MFKTLLLLVVSVSLCACCGYWVPSTPSNPLPEGSWPLRDGTYYCACNQTNSPGYLVMKTTANKPICFHTSQDTFLQMCEPGEYYVLFKRYTLEPKLVNSTKDVPLPKNSWPWKNGASTQYVCVAKEDGNLYAGTLHTTDPDEWRCYIGVSYGMGAVISHKFPGDYQVVVATECLIPPL